MPDLGQWLMLALIGLAVAATIAWPLLRPGTPTSPIYDSGAEAEARALRHRVALDALLDVEADRRAGSLDEASYTRERAEAEARAAQTLMEAEPAAPAASASPRRSTGRVAATWLGVALAAALAFGFALPAPVGLAERTLVNRALADELAREADRQAEIQRLLGLLQADPQDAEVLSDLADAYLAGSSAEDLQRAAVALQVLLAIEPEDRSAYRRLITAYITAGDWADAQAATDSYAGVAGPDEPDIPFFRGLIAFRSGDATAAVRHFDRFLALAPEDERVPMVTSLRAEAAGELDGAGASPGS
jgi:cytochrome c-type biogenesis protein CcmH